MWSVVKPIVALAGVASLITGSALAQPAPMTPAKPLSRDEFRASVYKHLDVLAGEHLHAEHLRIGVAAVARRAESLLMRH